MVNSIFILIVSVFFRMDRKFYKGMPLRQLLKFIAMTKMLVAHTFVKQKI